MIRFRRLVDAVTTIDKRRLAAVQKVFQQAFPYYPQYAKRIGDLVKKSASLDFGIILLVAEGPKARVLGFSLTFYFPKRRFAFLDYIASDPERSGRGIGGALYEATREVLITHGARGLFMEVPSDAEINTKESPEVRKLNARRVRFYERYGALAITGTSFDTLPTRANRGYLTYLIYDSLGRKSPLTRPELKDVIKRIFKAKYQMDENDPEVKEIVSSVRENPVKLREPKSRRKPEKGDVDRKTLRLIDVVMVSDSHKIHHLQEKGYVERPVRVDSIMKGLDDLPLHYHNPHHYGKKILQQVHGNRYLKFLEETESHLSPGMILYPDIFPVRGTSKLPRPWEMRIGYFCIDTFTPMTVNVYKAARAAANAALTGAHLLRDGSPLVYVPCRPPGHHAERNVYGGFCYLNNAAIAAQYLSAEGTVAILDMDYHHGNGTQDIFYERNDVLVLSIHGHPDISYPYFAGFRRERGAGEGKRFNRNYPLYPPVDNAHYLHVLDDALKHIVRFNPERLVVSLGLDIMKGDPSGRFSLTAQGMRQIGARLGRLGVPILVIQEGGYSLQNLRTGARAFLLGVASTLI